MDKFKGKLHFTPLNYPLICTFTSKVLNVTLYPLKLSNCCNSTILTFFFFPKYPYHIFYLKKKKSKKKEDSLYKYVMGAYFFLVFYFLFLNKICDEGILGKKIKMVELQQFESLEG